MDIDVDAYFKRIAYSGPREPTLQVLSDVLYAHMSRIPFENLDVLLDRGVRLDLASLQQKLVTSCRGGYCFEHSSLLAAVLERLGYSLERRAARVTLFSPLSEMPRTHMFLTVQLPEGVFVVDPGFGGFGARFPVPLGEMARDGRYTIMRVKQGEKTVDGWVTDLEEQNYPIDFEVGNYFTAMHPESMFRQVIMMSIVTPDGRVSVMNRDLSVHENGGITPRQLTDRAAFRKVLVEHYGFDLPELDTLRVPAIPEWG